MRLIVVRTVSYLLILTALFTCKAFARDIDHDTNLHSFVSTNPSRRAPLWVPVSVAVSADGALNSFLFEEHELFALRDYQRGRTERGTDSSRCDEALGEMANHSHSQPNETLADLVKSARGIYVGEVEKIERGFFVGAPSSLLQVRVSAVRSAEAVRPVGGSVFVHYSFARFSVGGQTYCGRPAASNREPRIGDRVLLFVLGSPVDVGGTLLTPESKELVFATNNVPVLPRNLQKDSAVAALTTFDCFVAQVTRMAGQIQLRNRGE